MIKKVLVANRGEIAIKIIHTLKSMGYYTIAIYSKFDEKSLHIKCADESHIIESDNDVYAYYDIESIISIAKKSDAIAIHPGIGFLSENADFANRCKDENIVFIGPNEKLLKEIYNKCRLKNKLKNCGFHIIGGGSQETNDVEIAIMEANKIGYPVVVKASLR